MVGSGPAADQPFSLRYPLQIEKGISVKARHRACLHGFQREKYQRSTHDSDRIWVPRIDRLQSRNQGQV